MSKWIDFKTLREGLSFPAVLAHYEVELKARSDGQAHGFCPLPTHDGEQRSPSFSAQLQRGVWQCFGCGAKGNVLDFAIRMEGLSPDKSADVRTVAVKLKDQFGIDCEVERPPREQRNGPNNGGGSSRKHNGKSGGKNGSGSPNPRPKAHTKPERTPQPSLLNPSPTSPSEDGGGDGGGDDATMPVKVNEPLDFELKGLQSDHPYLMARGFTFENMSHFGVGFCGRGSLANRIAIPLHDVEGHLVGYAGRVLSDDTISEDNPKYRLPSRRERNGTVLEFRKSHLLYNANRIKAPVDSLVVVEGFPSVWWLTQAGIANVVAVMGSSMSPEQAAIIKSLTNDDARVWIMPDGDDAGLRLTSDAMMAVGDRRWMRWIALAADQQPTALAPEELFGCLGIGM